MSATTRGRGSRRTLSPSACPRCSPSSGTEGVHRKAIHRAKTVDGRDPYLTTWMSVTTVVTIIPPSVTLIRVTIVSQLPEESANRESGCGAKQNGWNG